MMMSEIEERRPDLLGRADKDAAPLLVGGNVAALGQMPVSVLDHHDGGVDRARRWPAPGRRAT